MRVDEQDGRGVRVSVLITSYEHERFIGQAIEGVLEQRGVDYELIVGDDCSTDGSREVIDGYARRHPGRVVPFYPESNLGRGGKALFAELVKRSRGQYIAAMDGDDYWTSPDKLRLQVDHLDRQPACSMVFHNAVRRWEDRNVPDELYNRPGQPRRLAYRDFFGVNPVAACTPVFRREVLDPLPEWYFGLPWGDLSLYLLAAEAGEVHYLPEVMAVYRLHDAGMFTGLTTLEQQRGDVDFFRGLAGVVPPAEDRYRRRRLAVALAGLASDLARAGDHQEAQLRLAESYRAAPMDPRRLLPRGGELRRLALWVELHTTARRRWTRSARPTDPGAMDRPQPPTGT